jgi:multicomponent Na+:H+ antiporter subunit E
MWLQRREDAAVKYALALLVALAGVWMLWSGHTEPFMLLLGAASCLFVVLACWRMGILDSETVPAWLGVRPFVWYAPWLVKEIVKANLDVTKRVLRRQMPIQPTLIEIVPTQRTELGRVILANSITLTPGTVSVDMQDRSIRVHALTTAGAEDLSSGQMDRRVSRLEGHE